MKFIFTFLSLLFLASISYATENKNNQDEVTYNRISTGEITNNILNISVNGMVCDFCAQSIEKVFMKKNEVKGINLNLEDQKVLIYLEEKTNIENDTISRIFEDAGYTVEEIERNN